MKRVDRMWPWGGLSIIANRSQAVVCFAAFDARFAARQAVTSEIMVSCEIFSLLRGRTLARVLPKRV